MSTLNNILQQIELFAHNHKFLKGSFYFGKPAEATYNNAASYPMLVCQLDVDSYEVSENTDATTFHFMVLDVPNKDNHEINLREILSDTRSIARDLVSFFKYTKLDTPLLAQLPVVMNDLENVFMDQSAGWDFKIKLKSTEGLDLCGIPMENYTPPIDFNKVRILDSVTGEVLYRIPAGQSFTIEQLREVIDTLDSNETTIIEPLI